MNWSIESKKDYTLKIKNEDINYSSYSNQELKCLIAKHGDVKAQLDKEIWEVGNKLFCMIEELKKRSGGVDE